jgi:hypothetical protein
MLAQISQQIASIGTQTQIPLNTTTPLPYPTFHISASDRRVSILWPLSLVCSLSAAILSALVQQWVRAYMRIYQQSGNHLKTARIRHYYFEGVERLPVVAEAALALVHLSLLLFLTGLGDAVLKINTTIGAVTAIPIILCGYIYFYSVIAQIRNPRSPYRNPFSDFVLLLIQKLCWGDRFRPRGVWNARAEARQEKLAMEPTEDRKARDAHAIGWLTGNIEVQEMEPFLLALPGSFNQKWGREVWTVVSGQDNDPPRPTEGTTVDNLCGLTRFLFEAYNSNSMNKEALRRCMQGCIETVASLVCCTNINVQLDWFGEVGEVLSEVCPTEGVNELSKIRSNPSFTVPWTCLSLVCIRKKVMVEGRIPELAGFALNGIARFRSDAPDAATLQGPQGVDEYLKMAWEHVEDLHQAFEPWDHWQGWTGDEIRKIEIRNILDGCEAQISELERIGIEASGMDDVDWRIALLQDAMHVVNNKLMQRFPGVSFNEFESSGPILIKDAFNFPFFENTPITPQFLFLGQQLQSLSSLGQGLRDIIEDRNPEKHVETVKSLASISEIPTPLRRLKDLMIRQHLRLQDLRDGGGLGFTIELFFLALRHISSTSPPPELKEVFYTRTFKIITSGWENIADLSGTQRILANLICDIVIKDRGVFSNFYYYPSCIVDMLLKLVKSMADTHGNPQPHINNATEELWNVWNNEHTKIMNRDLWREALGALGRPSPPPTP